MRYNGPIFDVDVHHRWGDTKELLEYLPVEWREFAKSTDTTPAKLHYPFPFGTNKRLDTFGPNGEPPGSSLALMQEQLLDRLGISTAIVGYDVGQEMSHYNIPFTCEVARAANRWSSERWLSCDDRLRGSLMVPTQSPSDAATEVAYWGADHRFVSILLADNGLGLPFGHPAYDPLYAAAQEASLPIALHFGTPLYSAASQLAAGGMPLNRLEFFTILNHPGIHHVVSMVTGGVFERFPRLKVLVLEVGLAWLPGVLWHLDSFAVGLKGENPRLSRLPSDYVKEHMLFATQPLEPGPLPADFGDLLGTVDGVDKMICFASDYPHFDTDEAEYTQRFLPKAWLGDVFHRNAEGFFKDRS